MAFHSEVYIFLPLMWWF